MENETPPGELVPIEIQDVLESLQLPTAVANEAMERLLAGAKPLRPESWKKAWALVAGKHLTLENLDKIMQGVIEEAMHGDNPRSRMRATQIVMDLVDKLSAVDVAKDRDGRPIAIQINFSEKSKDYLVNVDG